MSALAVLARAVRAMGVQPRPFGALLATFLRLELRSSEYGRATGTEPGATIPPLYWVVGQLLTTSSLLTLLLFARVDVWFFAFGGLAATAVLLFSALVVEFREVALDPADVEIVGHRPLFPRTYAAARLSSLLFFVGLMTVTMAIFPTIVGAALRDAGPLFAPAYLAATVLVALGTTAFVIFLYTALGAGAQLERARGGLAWVQIIAILAVFYGGQLMLRNANGSLEMFAARPPEWVRSLPPALLADAVAAASWGRGDAALERLGIAAAAVAGASALAIGTLARAWARVHASARAWQTDVAGGAPVEGTVVTGATALFTSSRTEGAGYWLTRTLLRRDSEITMRVWPSFGMAIAAVVLGLLTSQLGNPMATRGPAVVLSAALPALVASAVPSVMHNLAFSRDHAAAWILDAAPVASIARFRAGVRKAAVVTFFAPLVAVLFGVLAWTWERPLDAAIQCGLGGATAWITLVVNEATAERRFPFSRPSERGSAVGFVAVEAALAGACGMLVGGAQYALGPGRVRHALLLGAIIVAALVLTRATTPRAGARAAGGTR